MITIALDPGASAGLAVWQGPDPTLLASRLVKTSPWDPKAMGTELRGLLEQAGIESPSRGGPPAVFVSEKMFLGHNDPRRAPTMTSLLRCVHTFETLAALMGMGVEAPIHPSTWQAGFGFAKGKSKARKARAVELVSTHLPGVLPKGKAGENVADAILLGLHRHLAANGGGATKLAQAWRPKT